MMRATPVPSTTSPMTCAAQPSISCSSWQKAAAEALGSMQSKSREQCITHAGRHCSHGKQAARSFRGQSFAQLEVEARVVHGSGVADARQRVDHKVEFGPLSMRRHILARGWQPAEVSPGWCTGSGRGRSGRIQ